MQTYPFSPVQGSTQTVAVTTTSQDKTFQTTEPSDQVQIYNKGPDDVFVRLGSGQTATTADYPCAPGVSIISKGNHLAMALVCPSSTATVYITEGSGF